MTQPQLRRVFAAFALTSTLFLLLPVASANAAGLARWGRADQNDSSWVEAHGGAWLRGWVVHLLEKAGVQIDPEGHK